MSATGHWNIVVKTPLGEQKIEADLQLQDGTLRGTMHDDKHPTAAIKEAWVEAGRIGWKYDVKKPFTTTLVFDVQVEGDAMTGTCKAGIFPAAPLAGTRAA